MIWTAYYWIVVLALACLCVGFLTGAYAMRRAFQPEWRFWRSIREELSDDR